MKIKFNSFLISTIAVSLLWMVFSFFQGEQIRVNENNNKVIAFKELSSITDRVDTTLSSTLQYAKFFELLIKKDPDISLDTLNEYASLIVEENPLIANIAIAPNGVVEMIYPLEENEDALGHDLLKDPLRSQYANRAIESRESVTQGPVESRQGGLMVFNRRAIFYEEDGIEKLWGLSAIGIRFESILETYQLPSENDDYLLALRVRSADGYEDFTWGNSHIFDRDSLIRYVTVPGELWEFAIYPQNGWHANTHAYSSIQYLFYFLMLVLFLFIFYYSKHYQEVKKAANRDSLTNSLSKRSFEQLVAKRLKAKNTRPMIAIIDLDNFKEVNDTLGHLAGDAVLVEVSNRIHGVLRNTDIFSRVGGDEFILFFDDIQDDSALSEIRDRISSEIERPISTDYGDVSITASIGMTIRNDPSMSYRALYNLADKNMYRDKQSKD